LCDKSNEERRRNKVEIPCNMMSFPVLSKEAYRIRTCKQTKADWEGNSGYDQVTLQTA
jgi:hypothetical protein